MSTSSVHAWLRRAMAVVAAASLAGCDALPTLWPAKDGYPYTTTDPISDFGLLSQHIYVTITVVVCVVFVLVSILLAVTLIKFADRGTPGNPEQVHGNITMEIGWTIAPIGIVLFLIVPTIRTIFLQQDAAPIGAKDENGQVLMGEDGKPLRPAVEIKVIGRRWWWQFEYVNEGIATSNQFAIPDDRPVSLFLTSDTVIHSFWAPRIGGKRDAIPGRVNRIWFNLTKDIAQGQPDHIRGECAEYCGEAHSLMRFEILGLDGADFDKWVSEYKVAPTFADASIKQKGEEAFSAAGCTGCHAISGFAGAKGTQGPNLTFLGDRRFLAAGIKDMYPNGRADQATARAVLTQWITDPNSIKPGTTKSANASRALDGMNIPADANGDGILQPEELAPEKVDAIVSYLLSQTSSFPLQ